jgi:hypothetical protein
LYLLYAIRQALNVPVELYSCCTGCAEVVIKLSPSPNNHLNLTASGEDEFVKVIGVFTNGGCGAALKFAVGLSDTTIVAVTVSEILQVEESTAINVIV